MEEGWGGGVKELYKTTHIKFIKFMNRALSSFLANLSASKIWTNRAARRTR